MKEFFPLTSANIDLHGLDIIEFVNDSVLKIQILGSNKELEQVKISTQEDVFLVDFKRTGAKVDTIRARVYLPNGFTKEMYLNNIGLLNTTHSLSVDDLFLSLNNVGKATLTLKSNVVNLYGVGISNIDMKGECKEINIKVNSGSNINLEQFLTKKAFVDLNSVSNIIMNVTNELSGNAKACSNFKLLGNPHTNTLERK